MPLKIVKLYGTCGKCNYEVLDPRNDGSITYARGCYWHIPCMTIHSYKEKGVPVADFPSGGRVIRRTLLTEE